MNAVGGVQGEGGAGRARPDFVVGDRDGTTCDAGFTEFVRSVLAGMGHDVRVNDPYKGVELVRAYSNPARGRMSLQLEINKRLYMDEAARTKSAGFEPLQRQLATLVDAVLDYAASELAVAREAMSARAAVTSKAGAPHRVQLKRSAGWKMPANTVKVDRTTRWGNPFTVAECGSVAVAVAQHGRWMRGEIAAPGGVEPPAPETLRARPRRPQPRLLVRAQRAVPRRPAACHRQRKIAAFPDCIERRPRRGTDEQHEIAGRGRRPSCSSRAAATTASPPHRPPAGSSASRGRGAGRRSP